MKVIRHETLGICLYADPKNKREQNFNEVMTEKAEAIRCSAASSRWWLNERYELFRQVQAQGRFSGVLPQSAPQT